MVVVPLLLLLLLYLLLWSLLTSRIWYLDFSTLITTLRLIWLTTLFGSFEKIDLCELSVVGGLCPWGKPQTEIEKI